LLAAQWFFLMSRNKKGAFRMFNKIDSAIALSRPTLVLSGSQAIVFQTSLFGAAVILPVLAHWFNAPVRYLLPMHWPVILAGLVYGWRGGALTGLLAPSVSYLVSGFPLPACCRR
jgi:hypothetical protein